MNAKVNELGLLQVSCRSLAPDIPQSWPLEFNLRPHERDRPAPLESPHRRRRQNSMSRRTRLLAPGERINAAFTQSPGKREKLTAPRLFQSLEQILGRSKGDWNGILVRDLWTSLEASQTGRALSVEHEEAWLILAGFLLRPGFGVAMDEGRIDGLWRISRRRAALSRQANQASGVHPVETGGRRPLAGAAGNRARGGKR